MEIIKIEFSAEYFNVKDTLECGQVFRFIPYKKGYAVFSRDKTCYAYNEGDLAVIECYKEDEEYFRNYFDLDRDYSKIYQKALSYNQELISISAKLGKGIRLLNQDKEEVLFSFIISQNNNIPRIKKIIESLCRTFGEVRQGFDYTYYTFPSAKAINTATLDELTAQGLGYRAPYIKKLGEEIYKGFSVEQMDKLDDEMLRLKLTSIYGVGPKVCDCVTLFGFKRTNSFPVDTWIEKVYRENMGGKEKDRKKIALTLNQQFGSDSGYIQQYLFYYKRTLENK